MAGPDIAVGPEMARLDIIVGPEMAELDIKYIIQPKLQRGGYLQSK